MLHPGSETGSRTTATTPTDTTTTPADPTATSPGTGVPAGTTVPADTTTTGRAPDPVPPAAGAAEEPCDLVTVPARHGLEAVDILRRGADQEAVGPVLHDGACDTLGFLVPPGTAEAWDVPGSACTSSNGRGLRIPVPAEPSVSGTGWLLPPAEDAPVTDPSALRAALDEAARVIEAADKCS
ncbi:hypothetical protein [Streptomyces sp. BE147]|uniref:hypothetical protein n=1 Tax=unclassified Streptomyces TaxID=2593676 RepID=UPI002E7A69A2|nr:hypothetical protein [Streptomyces sp. BE147]MEE1739602.1 hypothetical protein [Streptomyces sp. BE147]